MLVAQALLSSELFTGEIKDKDLIDSIYSEILRDKNNIVLIGMPGSGKTTYGKILSERLGRELIDTDDEIVKEAGMPINELFERYGEKHFRDMESELIERVSRTGGRIISTGGGAVLREENVSALKMNGKLIFLNRAAWQLKPTSDRPLADDANKIRKLYEERLPIYTAASDATVDLEGWSEDDADKIWEAML